MAASASPCAEATRSQVSEGYFAPFQGPLGKVAERLLRLHPFLNLFEVLLPSVELLLRFPALTILTSPVAVFQLATSPLTEILFCIYLPREVSY